MAATPQPRLRLPVGSPIRQARLVRFRAAERDCLLAVHAACAEDDPYHRMFFLPTDTLKLTAFALDDGERLWQVDLGPGMIPGVWFCPVLAMDLDGDGDDEIWLVNNPDTDHPLNYQAFVLERRSGRTGAVLEQHPWPQLGRADQMSHRFRNFLNGADFHGQPRLITAQGTYADMQLQAWDASLRPVWERTIQAEQPGARGSHMFPVIDLDGDGADEILWGERCIDLADGHDRWVGDQAGWRGHSDVIQPTLDRATGRWSVYTCREAGRPNGAVVMFNDRGEELWGLRGLGHMDMGWTARLGDRGEHQCYALEIGSKSAGPGGFARGGVVEYRFNLAGHPLPVEFPLFQSLPVDFNGDGLHELVYGGGERTGLVVDRRGEPLFQLTGQPRLMGKLLDAPGEQIVTADEDGTLRVYACPDAEDTPAARARYDHPYYAAAQRITAVGYNLANLGGL